MGLLDEAIREHLELKRRRGASPDEVSRQEHEALGPVRREPEPPAAVEEHAELLHDADVQPHAIEPEPGLAGPSVGEEPFTPLVESVPEEPLTPEPEPEAEAPAAAEPEAHDDWDFDPTDEHEAAAPAPEAPTPDEDVLEETPEFLQETPEHDRLWFEQKPPRDFDFDG